MRVLDQAWIGRALFVSGPAKGKARDVLTTNLANWWHPPRLVHTARPPLAAYFARRLFLWMPRKMWHMRVTCPNCGSDEELRSKGLYRRVRRVIDVTNVYYLAAEYMDCRSCKGTFVAWDLRILDQLPEGIRARFPVVLTYKYACDRAVIATLRARTLGNSPTAFQRDGLHLSESGVGRLLLNLSLPEQPPKQNKHQQQHRHVSNATNHDRLPNARVAPDGKWTVVKRRTRLSMGKCAKCGETNHVTATCRHPDKVLCRQCGERGHKEKHHSRV